MNESLTFSPTVVNQMGFSYSRPTGFDPCNHCEVPGLSVIGMTAGLGGTNGFAPGLFIQNNFEWRDVAAFNRGSHAFKAGVNLQTGESWTLGFAPFYTRPIYSFDSVLDFANDSPYYQTQQIINPVTGQYDAQAGDNDRNHAWGAFIQDDWKAKPNLTFNLGLRWEEAGNSGEELR